MIGSLNLVQGHPTRLGCETKKDASQTRAAWSAQSIGVLKSTTLIGYLLSQGTMK